MAHSKKALDSTFQILIHFCLIILSLMAILPFALLLMSSITSENVLVQSGYAFFPKEFSIESYEYLFNTNVSNIVRSYGITFFITVIGTSLSLIIGPLMAYAISRRDYPRRGIISFIVFFTMIFNGGLVPAYIMWTRFFHIRNTISALIFPNLLLNGFNILLMKSYFTINIHPSLIEAAKLDGAGEFQIYFNLVIPLSLPIIATIGLMVGINYWNDWQNGLYYITNPKLYSLQNLLNRILTNARFLASISTDVTLNIKMPGISIRMAMAVIGVVPILILYPFFQKYFIKGITLGGIKE